MSHAERNENAIGFPTTHEPDPSAKVTVTTARVSNKKEVHTIHAEFWSGKDTSPESKWVQRLVTGTAVVYVDEGEWDGWNWKAGAGTPNEDELQTILECVEEHRSMVISLSDEDGR